jgi:hypothetical protein
MTTFSTPSCCRRLLFIKLSNMFARRC